MPHNFDKEREFLRGCAAGAVANQAQPAECYPQGKQTSPGTPISYGVRDRIYQALDNANRTIANANAAARAKELLDRYPGLDELLDLVSSGKF